MLERCPLKSKSEFWNSEIPVSCKGCISKEYKMRDEVRTPMPLMDNPLVGVDADDMEDIISYGIARSAVGNSAGRVVVRETIIADSRDADSRAMLVLVEEYKIDCTREI
jgi:hypothetical protein